MAAKRDIAVDIAVSSGGGNVKVSHWVQTLLAPNRASEQAEQQEQVSHEEDAV